MSDPTALPSFPPPPQEQPLTGRVLDALHELGMPAELDSDGDVALEASGQRMFVKALTGERLDIMRVFGTWQIASTVPEDLLTRLNGCNDVTLGVNLVKAGIANGNLVLSVEQIMGPQEPPSGKLQVAIGLILQALQLWHRNILAKSRAEQGLDPEIPEDAAEGTEVGPWLSVGPDGARKTGGDVPRPDAADAGAAGPDATGTGTGGQPGGELA